MNWQSWTVTSVFYSFVVSVRFTVINLILQNINGISSYPIMIKENQFHVEEYMKHQMEVRLSPEEAFDLYVYEGSELEKQSNSKNEGIEHVT